MFRTKNKKINKPAFTLIELLVVIAIIGVLATLAVVSLQNARKNARDAKRIADIRQIQTALELYYNSVGQYPSEITDSIASDNDVYMAKYPSAPTPADGDCEGGDNTYSYTQQSAGASYTIGFCLGGTTGNLSPGLQEATPAGVTSMSAYETCSASTVCGSTCSYEGTNYPTVEIGSQCWFAKNLNVGTRINSCLTGQLMEMEWSYEYGANTGHYYTCCTPEDVELDEWEGGWEEYCGENYEGRNQADNSVAEKYCYADNNSNCSIYGGLYQWDEAMEYSEVEGSQGLCPSGWHIATDAQWTTLITYLGGEIVAGGKMKETGTTHWNSPNTEATNTSGFTALPAGRRYSNGSFKYVGSGAYFWSSSVIGSDAWYRSLHYSGTGVGRDNYYQALGFSVRCFRTD